MLVGSTEVTGSHSDQVLAEEEVVHADQVEVVVGSAYSDQVSHDSPGVRGLATATAARPAMIAYFILNVVVVDYWDGSEIEELGRWLKECKVPKLRVAGLVERVTMVRDQMLR